ncbi:MAG: hypothetical protein Q9163_002346 [Psora crenata]
MSSIPLSPPTSPPRVIETPPSLLPSAIPAADEATQSNINISSHADDPLYDDNNNSSNHHPPPPPPDFKPFFTLVTNITSPPTTHHPSVHYIFEDDPPDTSPITSAALRILDPSPASAATSSTSPTTDRSRQSSPKRKERYVLLDLDDTGTRVVSAQSMSPDWAVVATELCPAPTWNGEQVGEEENDGRGMMLKIDGMEMLDVRSGRLEGGGEGEGEGLETLVEEYERRLVELRRVVAAGRGTVSNQGAA